MDQGIVAVIVRQARVLVIRRAEGVPFPGHWSPVSGKIESGEEQAEALVREAREELGLGVVPVRKVWECPSSDGHYRLHWWLAVPAAEDLGLSPDPREVEEVRWIRPADFRQLEPVFEADVTFFERILPRWLPGPDPASPPPAGRQSPD